MRYKVSELEGALLDAAVAKAEGVFDGLVHSVAKGRRYSSDWADGGPIIDRELIGFLPSGGRRDGLCVAFVYRPSQHDLSLEDAIENRQYGPTLLIAAMRAYVASRFGNEIDL